MFRTALSAALLPLEFLSIGMSSRGEPTAATWWMVAATLVTACPTAVHVAQRLFGDRDEQERRPALQGAARLAAVPSEDI